MPKTIYGLEARLLICGQCGAPFEVKPEGGTMRCGYCNAVSVLAGRGTSSTLSGEQKQRMSEPQRHERLRAQDGKPLLPPQPLMRYLMAGGLNPQLATEAQAEWQTARAEVEAGAPYGTEERLYFLTLLLSGHFSKQGDELRSRAFVESALETMRTPRHEQVLRCQLARSAARLGDIPAAAGWLKGCDAFSDDIYMDTAYRVTAATLCTVRRDFRGVLQQLGAQIDDVPIADGQDELVAMLRANAHERLGNLPLAIEQLERFMQKDRRIVQLLESIREVNKALELCTASFPAAKAKLPKASSPVQSGGFKLRKIAGVLPFTLLSLGFFIGAIFVDADAKTDDGYSMTWFLVFMGVCFSIGPALMIIIGLKSAKKRAYMMQHGLDATATVVGVSETGVRVNNQPRVAINLQVSMPDRAPYPLVHHQVVSHFDLARLAQPGATLTLKVDPKNPENVMVV